MKLFLGVDGGQSGTSSGHRRREPGEFWAPGRPARAIMPPHGEGRAKLERAVTGSVAAACAQAGLDGAAVGFEAALFRNERRSGR